MLFLHPWRSLLAASGLLIASVVGPTMALADGGGCFRMHDWRSKEPGLFNPWDRWHSTQSSVIYDPEVVVWDYVADKGFRSNAHSDMEEGYVDNVSHPTCGGEV